jgi:threonine/homoserine efflux transporter RhtA
VAASSTQPGPSSPLRFAALLGGLVGVGLFGLGLSLLFRSATPNLPLGIAVLILGFLETVLAWYAVKRSRPAWAFALSVNGTSLLVFLFGAPKVRDASGLPIGVALIPPVVFAVVLALYAMSADEY